MVNAVSNLTSGNVTPQGLGVLVNEAEDLKTDFLRLLTTQLQNQDPLSPMDNTQMVQQLATFSQLEQLEGVNSKLEQNMQYSQSLTNNMMMNLVGRRVTVLGDGVTVQDGAPSRTLVRTAEQGVAQAKIYDANGKVVRTIPGLRLNAGYTEVKWDGLDKDGNPLPDGDYRMEISAQRTDGSFLSVAVFQSGIVETLQFDNNYQTIIVNGRGYSPSDIVEVGLAENWSSSTGSVGGGDGEDDEDDTTVGGGSDDDPTNPLNPDPRNAGRGRDTDVSLLP